MAYKLALVDFDGTLVDSMSYWLNLPLETLKRNHIPEPEGFREYIAETPMWQVAIRLAKEYPQLVADCPLTDDWYAMMRENYMEHIQIFPEMPEVLRQFREQGMKIYIVSATRQPLLNDALEHFGLLANVDAVFSEGDVGSKREAETYVRLSEISGVPLKEMLLVEDSLTNLAAAAVLGVGTMQVHEPFVARD